MLNFVKKLFDYNQKELKRVGLVVEKINSFEPAVSKLSDKALAAKTVEFKKKIAQGADLTGMIPEVFAVVREVGVRVIDQRAFDTQLITAVCLWEGKIAELRTGEGKTLAAVFPLYFRALEGKGAHLVTVNDYLAKIGCGWMGGIFDFLGLSVGCIIPEQSYIYDTKHKATVDDRRLIHLKLTDRKQAYLADITYGTSNEFGFDYLRDNMVQKGEDAVQRGHFFAIADEVDFSLIDEARTPLIISSPQQEATEKYYRFAKLAADLASATDYVVDEKSKTAVLSEFGIRKVERALGFTNLYEEDFDTIHHIENALKAVTLFQRDKDYIIQENQVVIIDEFTGRMMHGRRWSDGLHQAVEAKEGVPIQRESRTWATITFQNYFRMYQVLSGMTGTAATEAEEFKKIYNLEVIVIPTNKPIVRKDLSDEVYKSQRAKYTAVVAEIEKRHRLGQPVLVGTTSIEKNEMVDNYLKKKKIPHQILNAKHHQQEAKIIAQAGKLGAVTIATNMAGRGVDIVLGGETPSKTEKNYKGLFAQWQKDHQKVKELGGLCIIGTERHESRRIDNQLRGRAGRQGDPGASKFFVSLEDDLMRVFGGEQIAAMMTRFKMPENMPVAHAMVGKMIGQIQSKVEGFNFDIRRSLVEFDDIVNKQRTIVYKQRRQALDDFAENPQKLKEDVLDRLDQELEFLVSTSLEGEPLKPSVEKIVNGLAEILAIDDGQQRQLLARQLKGKEDEQQMVEALTKLVRQRYADREKLIGPDICREIEKSLLVFTLDNLWVDHLTALESLKQGVRLRGYGQRDPLVEYRKESYQMFQELLGKVNYHLARRIFRVEVGVQGSRPSQVTEKKEVVSAPGQVSADTLGSAPASQPMTVVNQTKVGRNDSCPCGSGKKYKKCCYPKFG
ncbi:MAG: preprotein translocase subunit SecA [Patescibacteria group bacterium]